MSKWKSSVSLLALLTIACGKPQLKETVSKDAPSENATAKSETPVSMEFALPEFVSSEVQSTALSLSGESLEEAEALPVSMPQQDKNVGVEGECLVKKTSEKGYDLKGSLVLQFHVLVPDQVAAIHNLMEKGQKVEHDMPAIPKDGVHLRGTIGTGEIEIPANCAKASVKFNGLLKDHSYQLVGKIIWKHVAIEANGEIISKPLYRGKSDIFSPSLNPVNLKMIRVKECFSDGQYGHAVLDPKKEPVESEEPKIFCQQIYEPVCGELEVDGKKFQQSFPNMCYLNLAKAELLNEGECEPQEESCEGDECL